MLKKVSEYRCPHQITILIKLYYGLLIQKKVLQDFKQIL